MSFYDDEERARKRHRSREVSQRVGQHRGQPARTFHFNIDSVKIGDGKTSIDGAVDYLARGGEFEKKNADLEHVAGDADRVKIGALLVEDTARVRKGPTAERVLLKETFELPKELDREGRAEVAERIVSAWEEKGHWTVAAVHANGQVQPHVHVAVVTRPIVEDPDTELGARADRDPARVALRGGKAEMRAERHRVADLINQVLDERQVDAPRFHGGRDREMDVPGIQGRKPKRRLPQRAWHVRQERERDPQLVAEARARAEEQRRQAAEAARARKKEEVKRRRAQLRRLGAVPKAHADHIATMMQEEREEVAKRDAEIRQVRQNSARALDYAWDRMTARIRAEGGDPAELRREDFDSRMNTDPEYAGMVWGMVRESDEARKAQEASQRPQERPAGSQSPTEAPKGPEAPLSPSRLPRTPQRRPRRPNRGIELD